MELDHNLGLINFLPPHTASSLQDGLGLFHGAHGGLSQGQRGVVVDAYLGIKDVFLRPNPPHALTTSVLIPMASHLPKELSRLCLKVCSR